MAYPLHRCQLLLNKPIGYENTFCLPLHRLALLCKANSLFGQKLHLPRPSPRKATKTYWVTLGDPYVLHDTDGTYYMYGTGGRTGFPAYSSKDLVNWKNEGQVYANTPEAWGNGSFWAPEVYKIKNKYYLFYSAQ